MYYNGSTNNYLVLQLLGNSIERLFDLSNNTFPVATVIQVINQMLSRVEYIHHSHIIHRDIKPSNFVIGRTKEDNQMIYLIDFGLSRFYEDPNTLIHIPYKIDKYMTGNARYTSVSSLLGVEQSRKDDLESIGYILIYLSKGILPWQGIKTKNKIERHIKIKNSKLVITPEELCSGLPYNFLKYFHYVKGLQFTDKPNYDYLRSLLISVWKYNDLGDRLLIKINWNKAKTNQNEDDNETDRSQIISQDMLLKTK